MAMIAIGAVDVAIKIVLHVMDLAMKSADSATAVVSRIVFIAMGLEVRNAMIAMAQAKLNVKDARAMDN